MQIRRSKHTNPQLWPPKSRQYGSTDTHLGELDWESDLSQSVFQLWKGYPSTFLMDWNVRRVNARCSGVPLMGNIPMALFHIKYRIQNLFHRHKSYTLLFFFFFWLGNVLYRGICCTYLGL